MARFRVHKGWEFVMSFDQEFISRHVEVAQRQQMLWDRKFQQLAQILNVTKADLKLAANATSSVITSPRCRRTTSRSRSKSGGEMSMSDQSDADMDVQKSDKRRHYSGPDRRHHSSGSDLKKLHLGAGGDEGDNVENGMDVDRMLSPASDINGTTIDLGALKLELVKVAADRLASRHVLSTSDFKRLFLLKLAECPPGHILGCGVSDKQLEESLLLAGAQKLNFGPNTDSVYILNKVGDGWDEVRAVLIGMLKEKPQVRLSSFRKKVDEAGIDVLSDNDLRKLLKEYLTWAKVTLIK
jgi:DNA-directed RNA polymerase-3 subunit RPC5